jgi:hypothetical protein
MRAPGSRDGAAPTEVKVASRGKWPVVLAAPDGRVLASWKQDGALHWRIFDAEDQPLGEVQSQPTHDPNRFAGVAATDGTFLLFD